MTAELFEPPPPKRLIVPRGSTGYLGVDWSTKAVSVGSAINGRESGVYRAVRTISWPDDLKPEQRLHWAHGQVRDVLAAHLRAGVFPVPGVVGVEQPGTNRIDMDFLSMYGVVRAAVYAALVDAKVPVCAFRPIVASWWKKRACGDGSIRKPKKRSEGPYRVHVWAQSRGYRGTDWNEADALGIAEGLRREYLLEER